MVSHYPVKFGGHSHCGGGDIVLLAVEKQDSTCSIKSAIISKALGMSCSYTSNFRT